MDQLDIEVLLKIYNCHKISRIYIIKGRRYINIYQRGTIVRYMLSYARALMTVKLGRILKTEEEVDHIDEDKANDTIGNLQILSPANNLEKYFDNKFAKKYGEPVVTVIQRTIIKGSYSVPTSS